MTLNTESINPYQAPEMDPQRRHARDPQLSPVLSRQSVLGLMLLCWITVGIYCIIWLLRRTRDVNQLVPARQISGSFMALAVILQIANLLVAVASEANPYNSDLVATSSVIDLLAGIILLVWAFRIRSRLNEAFRLTSDAPGWVHGFWTFMFGILYLQFKINRLPKSLPVLQAEVVGAEVGEEAASFSAIG